MKSLFNKYEAYNTHGNEVSNEMQQALEPIIEKWANRGYKITDIESIAVGNVITIGCILRLKKSIRMVKDKAKKNRLVG